ncbi:pyridoxamine 5'-phosphate oxidase [Actinoplanes sp. ATCC 53533]|uniref:pyridoxamine 5'-phosphate oxidase family protein n=1 Tax=Actinoplanes sp. ATCC 53533 TaxID=1288362 RepID=UPI000F777248|nr:TIGR03618 family F420-dependent PPOX class oxidoreductase [Actinoplanes sp. ATCC 53533]RSM57978.1 pyridoxamine 5'-phosphate oxidase [Actinoplanes sp. ATCC 53533]
MTPPRAAAAPSARAAAFLADSHLGTLTTLRPDGSPHVTAVRFTWNPAAGLARVLTVASSRKVRNVVHRGAGRVALCQVSGPRWITLEGTATVSDDPARVGDGVRAYRGRYRSLPPVRPGRVVMEIAVDRILTLNL